MDTNSFNKGDSVRYRAPSAFGEVPAIGMVTKINKRTVSVKWNGSDTIRRIEPVRLMKLSKPA